jgi:hypothetical protein
MASTTCISVTAEDDRIIGPARRNSLPMWFLRNSDSGGETACEQVCDFDGTQFPLPELLLSRP